MTFKKYQKRAIVSKIYPNSLGVYYTLIGLFGESGEIAEKIKKIIRDKEGIISEQDKGELSKELGDVLWYLTALADELGLSLEEIAKENIVKLDSRAKRGKLEGSGDNR